MASANQPVIDPTDSKTIPQSNGTPAPALAKAGELLSEAEFERKNQRRIDLIRKDTWGESTTEERHELERLDAEVGAHVRAKFTGMDEMLDRMEERARRLGYVP